MSVYNQAKLKMWQDQLSAHLTNGKELKRGTTAYRIHDAETKAIQRKISALELKIATQQETQDIEKLLESVARIPLMRVTLEQRKMQFESLRESIAELESDIATLESERTRLLSQDDSE